MMHIQIGSNGPNDPTEGLVLKFHEHQFLDRLMAHDWLFSQSPNVGDRKRGDEREAFLKMYATGSGGNCLQMFNRFCYMRRKYLAKLAMKESA